MNGVYHIQDYHSLLNQIGDLQQVGQDILRVKENLISQCQLISNAWTSNTTDKETYLRNIYNNLDKVEKLIAALNTLSNELNDYAKNSMQIASNGIY